MIRSEEIDTLPLQGGGIVILTKEAFDAIAEAFDIPTEVLSADMGAINIDLNAPNRVVGVDLVHSVHNGEKVTESILINAHPDKFKRFLLKHEKTFDEYKNEATSDPEAYKVYLRNDTRPNPDLDAALGIL
jgi:hypothetical protein